MNLWCESNGASGSVGCCVGGNGMGWVGWVKQRNRTKRSSPSAVPRNSRNRKGKKERKSRTRTRARPDQTNHHSRGEQRKNEIVTHIIAEVEGREDRRREGQGQSKASLMMSHLGRSSRVDRTQTKTEKTRPDKTEKTEDKKENRKTITLKGKTNRPTLKHHG